MQAACTPLVRAGIATWFPQRRWHWVVLQAHVIDDFVSTEALRQPFRLPRPRCADPSLAAPRCSGIALVFAVSFALRACSTVLATLPSTPLLGMVVSGSGRLTGPSEAPSRDAVAVVGIAPFAHLPTRLSLAVIFSDGPTATVAVARVRRLTTPARRLSLAAVAGRGIGSSWRRSVRGLVWLIVPAFGPLPAVLPMPAVGTRWSLLLALVARLLVAAPVTPGRCTAPPRRCRAAVGGIGFAGG